MKNRKNNGNNINVGDYYLGLDIGTNSVGWAVTSEDYDLLKFKGKNMWGSRLFEEAQSAEERRKFRLARRLNKRKHQRLELLKDLFNDAIYEKDPMFYRRLEDSSLVAEDKREKVRYSLFNDADYKDKDYMKDYPTVYHLRQELINSKEPHDVRLVFLALHHIIKNRGHFLFATDSNSDTEYKKTVDILNDFIKFAKEKDVEFLTDTEAREKFINIITDKITDTQENGKGDVLRLSEKKKIISGIFPKEDNTDFFSAVEMANLIAGSKVQYKKLFPGEENKNLTKSADLSSDFETLYADAAEELNDEQLETLEYAKNVFDAARLEKILGEDKYISDAKVKQYEENKDDLKALKDYVKEYCPEKKAKIFRDKSGSGEENNSGYSNFAMYCNKTLESGEKICSQEDLCKFLSKELKDTHMEECGEKYAKLWQKIEDKTFFPKLRSSENGTIPNQLHFAELKKILENASGYLDFLNEADEDGITVKQKIEAIFRFKIPYYVGPLNKKGENAWIVRKSDGKILPWNFDETVNKEKCAEGFMKRLKGKCTYTAKPVLPKDSLLYSEYMLLNEINSIKVNNKPLPVELKNKMIEDLFKQQKRKVTKKTIREWLENNGYDKKIADEDISGVDQNIKTKLKAYHDFTTLLTSGKLNEDDVDEIIEHIIVFGDEKQMLKKWLNENYPVLDDGDRKYISRLVYKDWGNLSKEFLSEIYYCDEETGEAITVMDRLRDSNCTLMKVLNDKKYDFAEQAEEMRQEQYGGKYSINEEIDEMYVSPALKRSIKQTLRIVDEVVDVRKSAPKKIFVEAEREHRESKRTESRKDKLIALYKNCKGEEYSELLKDLQGKSNDDLRKDALYLYYLQMGRCMYTKEKIELDDIYNNNIYDIDHIYPQSKIQDDSIDNRVLVKKSVNARKTNEDLSDEIRNNMYSWWKMLFDKGFISKKKHDRLMYNPTEEDLRKFAERQLTFTQQSTKYVINMLKKLYPNTEIIYSKAGNVSEFRHEFNMIKCREVNDYHHAKDAYLNIVVGNVYDTKFSKKFFLNFGSEKYSMKTGAIFGEKSQIDGAWNGKESLSKVKKVMSGNNILISRMPYEVKGGLFDANLVAKGKGQMEAKQGRDVNKYGGYNKRKGAYFFVVECTEKGKKTYTVEPVYIYAKNIYEQDPIKYCREILHMTGDIRITCPKILTDSLLELNGGKMYITGRSLDRLRGKHDYQLVLDSKWEYYIKRMAKFVDNNSKLSKDEKLKKEWEYNKHTKNWEEVITKERNEELYEIFAEKLNNPVYSRWLSNVYKACDKGRDKFYAMELLEQGKLLLEILKSFKCNSECSNLKTIGGGATIGTIVPHKKLKEDNKPASAYLISRSVTGLYETRTDLLK